MESIKNLDFDVLVVEFQKGKKSKGSASIKKEDLLTLVSIHNATVGDIVEDMAYSIFESQKKK
jgi:CheY-specific phosphatase CheX